MKRIFLLLMTAVSTAAISQITIVESDFANGGDTVIVSSSDDTSLDFNATGADFSWDFSTINIETQRIDTFYDISSAEFLYQAVFNNGFTNPDYESDYFLPWSDVDFSMGQQVGLSIEDPVAFTKKSSTKIEGVGFGIKANGFSIPASSDTIDVKYELPMTFNDTWTSNSYTELDLNPAFDGIYLRYQQRTSVVDGWGQITTPFKTYDVVRVKSNIESQDSVFVNLFGGQWIELPVPASVEYSWFANGEKIPVFSIVTQDIGGETITSVEFRDKKRDFASINQNENTELSIFPNPATSEFFINTDQKVNSIQILDISGKVVYTEINPLLNQAISISHLKTGTYVLSLDTENGKVNRLITKK